MVQLVKNLLAMQETWVQSLGWENPVEKGKATHSSILAEKSMDHTVHGVAKSWTPLSDIHFHFFQARILEWIAVSYSKYLPDPGIKVVSHMSLAL